MLAREHNPYFGCAIRALQNLMFERYKMKLTIKPIRNVAIVGCFTFFVISLAAADAGSTPVREPASGEEFDPNSIENKGAFEDIGPFEDIDTILNTQLESSEYSETQNCIYTRSYDGIEIIDERHLLFKGKRGKAWINQLRHRCTGLTGDKILFIDIRGSRLCMADTFSAREKGDNFTISPLCRFGKFQAVSEEQLPLLHEALAKYAETRTVHKTTQTESK